MCFFSAFSPIWLKAQLVAKQRLLCHGHSQVMGAHPLCPMRIRGFVTTHKKLYPPIRLGGVNLASEKHPAAFANGQLVIINH